MQRAVELFQQEIQQVQEALSNETIASTSTAAAAGTADDGVGAGATAAGDGGTETQGEVAGYAEVLKNLKEYLQFAVAHRDVIAKWGRFPHRNQVLGREPTPEEVQGMEEGTIPKFG